MKRLGTQHPLCLLNLVALKLASLFWTKLGSVTAEQYALVARVVSQAEIDRTPEAKTAMDKEWQKLFDKSCWLHEKVREYRDVAAEARSVFQGITGFPMSITIARSSLNLVPAPHQWRPRR